MRESVRGWSAPALRELRQAAGLSQEDLASLAGCAPSAVGTWESGRYGPQPRHAIALAEALGVSIHDLITFEAADAALRDLRAWAGLTQTEVRQQLSLRDIGAMERGTKPVPPEVAPALAQLYGVTVVELQAAAERTREGWRRRLDSKRG